MKKKFEESFLLKEIEIKKVKMLKETNYKNYIKRKEDSISISEMKEKN